MKQTWKPFFFSGLLVANVLAAWFLFASYASSVTPPLPLFSGARAAALPEGAPSVDASSPSVASVPWVIDAPIRLFFLGDMMLDRSVALRIKERGFEDLLRAFREEGRFEQYDLVIANLEGPFSEQRIKTTKSIAFRFDPALAPELRWLGIDAVSLANNHAFDMGTAAYAKTQELLSEQGTVYFGHPTGAGDEAVTVIESRGERVALVGFNTTFHTLTERVMTDRVRLAREQADYVVVFMHWGDEYKEVHNATQEKLAHALIDAGADAVIGAHPHVVQDSETYAGKPIYYSLGNFIFDQYFSAPTQQGIGVEVQLSQSGVTATSRRFEATKSEPRFVE